MREGKRTKELAEVFDVLGSLYLLQTKVTVNVNRKAENSF